MNKKISMTKFDSFKNKLYFIQARHTPWAPGAVFSVMCFVVIVIVLYLPETRGMDLPQTLEEVKIWYAENSGIRVQKYKRKKANQESKTIVVPYNKN